MKHIFLCLALIMTSVSSALAAINTKQEAEELESQVIKWRHHIHMHPELSNREFETAKYVSNYLKRLGLEVQTGVAKTGVVAILDSGKPGPVVALRADMDALPVLEQNDLPWKSSQIGEYNGEEVPVMHACGHDTHVAMLMGAATILVEHKQQLKGKVKFIFQPAEEGPPAGEEGGAPLMIKQGVLKNPDVDVIFGLHANPTLDVGKVSYKPGGSMAAIDAFKIVIHGKQSHGAYPWQSVDPIVTAAQLIMSLQTIVSREIKLIDDAAVVTVGSIVGGNRTNIIPEKVELLGTIRTLDKKARELVYEAVQRKVKGITESMGATAEIDMPYGGAVPITYNAPDLVAKMLPTLQRTAGIENTISEKAVTAAEDFSFYQEQVPGVFLWIGVKPLNVPKEQAAPLHSPDFIADDKGLKLGVEVLVNLTIDYMNAPKAH